MSIKNKTLAYFRLMRFHAGAQEALFPLIGALIVGMRDLILLGIIFVVGLFFHIFGHVLNDYLDIAVDKKSAELKDKPLISGITPASHAIAIIVIAIVIPYILIIIFFPTIYTILFFSLALLFGGLYDIYGKKIPGISDAILGSSFTFSYFFGVSTVTISFTNLVFIVGALIFVGIIFANVVEGGLKDVDHDYLGGKKTLATIMGVKVKEGKLKISRLFSTFAYILLTITFILLILLLYQPEINFFKPNYMLLVLITTILIIVLFCCNKLLTLKEFNRSKVKRFYFIINTGVGVLLLISLFPIIGIEIFLILLIFPVGWYIVFNKILYGKAISPAI
jgi:4-hydroxybenzoate polyprenyltransferase